ncbi:MAG: transposase [Candidatus Methanoperedens sp.]|nr:transposase [Candidatus Methanoperedens sp.]
MSDAEWEKVEPYIPKRKTKLGRKREHLFTAKYENKSLFQFTILNHNLLKNAVPNK